MSEYTKGLRELADYLDLHPEVDHRLGQCPDVGVGVAQRVLQPLAHGGLDVRRLEPRQVVGGRMQQVLHAHLALQLGSRHIHTGQVGGSHDATSVHGP